MVDIREAFPSSFVLAGEDIKSGDIITFLDGGRLEESPQFGKLQLIFKCKVPSGEEKNISINATSRKALSEVWGTDTESWRGKKPLVTVTRQLVGGKMKNVITLEPEGADAAPATA